MFQLYRTYLQLCLFRGSVSAVDASTTTLVLLCALFALTTFALFQLSPDSTDPVNYYSQTLVIFLVFNLFMFLALVYKKSGSRYRKVLSAFIGTRTLIDLGLILIAVLFSTSEEVRNLLSVIVSLWRMCIVGYILKHGLDVSLPGGILLAIGFTILSIIIADVTIDLPLPPGASSGAE